MPVKVKKTQPLTPDKVQGRDNFQTPNYATEVLVPFIPKNIRNILEPACGELKISNVLYNRGFTVYSTDLKTGNNFLTEEIDMYHEGIDCVITNPPFSAKRKFYDKCRSYGLPFALLIPCDYCGWVIEAIQDGAEKLIPTKRVDYITPNMLNLCNDLNLKAFIENHDVRKFKKFTDIPEFLVEMYREHVTQYKSVDEVPYSIKKHFTSNFHSMWLTWGFGLGKTETFVELTTEMKRNI